jgi:hypothetical protein
MNKQKIFYIDDQSFAIPQLINSIPKHIDYEFIYIQRVKDLVSHEFDLVILDFYLDKDDKTALDIVDKFSWMKVLSFSTSVSKNIFMLDNWAQFQSLKLKNTNENPELKKVLEKIFSLT